MVLSRSPISIKLIIYHTCSQPIFKSLLPDRQHLFLIDNPGIEQDEHLMEMLFVQVCHQLSSDNQDSKANRESPFFVSEYKKIQQNIEFTFRTLNITLHQEALVKLKTFGEKLAGQLKKVQEQNPAQASEFIDGGRKLSRKLSQLR